MYIVFHCIKHFTTYRLCCESLETAVDRKKEKKAVYENLLKQSTATTCGKSDHIQKVVLFNLEHLEKLCEDAT